MVFHSSSLSLSLESLSSSSSPTSLLSLFSPLSSLSSLSSLTIQYRAYLPLENVCTGTASQPPDKLAACGSVWRVLLQWLMMFFRFVVMYGHLIQRKPFSISISNMRRDPFGGSVTLCGCCTTNLDAYDRAWTNSSPLHLWISRRWFLTPVPGGIPV